MSVSVKRVAVGRPSFTYGTPDSWILEIWVQFSIDKYILIHNNILSENGLAIPTIMKPLHKVIKLACILNGIITAMCV